MGSLICAVALLTGALSAAANTIVYSEDFNAGGFLGSYIGDVGNFSERWTDTRYHSINDFNGWTFTGNTPLLARQTSTGNQAVLLNEPSGVATYLSGLNPNTLYELTFNLSGDNQPGSNYRFLLDINGGNVLDITAQWTTTTPAGHPQTVQFTTGGSGNALFNFYQASQTGSSPIIDDVVVSSVPDGGTTAALLGSVLMGLGVLRRKIS